MHRLLLRLPLLVSACAVVVVGACQDPPAANEGEGDGNEGEGDATEGEGDANEGEGEPGDVTATLTAAPNFPLAADGTSAFTLTVTLAGENIANRNVAISTDVAGPEEASAVSDNAGVATVDLVSSVAGSFVVVVTVDGNVVDTGDVRVEFSPCRSLGDEFTVSAYPVLFSRCIGCHNEFGFAPSLGARFVLPFVGDDNFGDKGVAAIQAIVDATAADGSDVNVDDFGLDEAQKAALQLQDGETVVPRILANPIIGDAIHTGGVVINADEAVEIARFRGFLHRLEAGDTCNAGSDHGLADEDLLRDVTLLSPQETLKKATLTMTGKPATAAAVAAVTDEASLAAAIDAVLDDPDSETRMREVWNDWLLTDEGIGGQLSSLGLTFPDRFFFEPLRSEGARGGSSCDDVGGADCCRIAEDPLNLDNNPDNDVPLKPENVACIAKRTEARKAVFREPLEILLRIWRDGRPASELVTGDYTVVNPALARVFGLVNANGRTFKDGVTPAFNNNPDDDDTETRLVRVIETDKNNLQERNAVAVYPHQGILSTNGLLHRFPTTTSNRERTRARIIYERLLGVPVMKLAAFATPEIPEGKSLENLTWDTQPCIVCHTLLDPVAATFNHFTGSGAQFTTRRPCRNDGMRAPGFGYIALPGSDDENAGVPRPALDDELDCPVEDLATGEGTGALDSKAPARLDWIADRVVEHPRFAYAVTVPLYESIVGALRLSPPDSLADPDFDGKARAFATQQKELESLVAAFRAGGGRFKPVVKAVLLGRSFRAAATAGDVDAGTARSLELLGVGAGALLTPPEVLARKVENIVGIPWTHLRSTSAADNLLSDNFYSIFAGGIDSGTVTLRGRDPVAVQAAVARRLGNELSCLAVPQDFSIVTPAQRKLFSLVETTDVPLDDAGAVIADADAKVVAQIRQLQKLLWNEEAVDDAEVEASHQLFLAALRAMRAPTSGTATPAAIGGTCQATSQFVRGPTADRPAYPANGTVVLDGVEHKRVAQDPTFTVRAWTAVLSSLLADSRFLFE